MIDEPSLNLDELKQFLMRANMPHAMGTAELLAEADGSRTIEHLDGDYRMHDNFFGGEPYGGRLVIFHHDAPVFMEVYYGIMHKLSSRTDEIYEFLREALQHPDSEHPFRGPATYTRAELTYTCNIEGDIAHHTVKEYIHDGGEKIYSATILGGLVDQNMKGTM